MSAAPFLANNVVCHHFSNAPFWSICDYLGIVIGMVAVCTKRVFSHSELVLLPIIRCNPPLFKNK